MKILPIRPKNTICANKIAFLGLLALAFLPLPAFAAATLTQQVDPPQASVGDRVSVTFTVQGGAEADIQLPTVSGLFVEGNSTTTQITFVNGTLVAATSQTFNVVPQRAGDFTIPAFDIHTHNGETLHAHAMKLHVVDDNAPAPAGAPVTPTNGPVVMPPASANAAPAPAPGDTSDDQSSPSVNVPVGRDGRPAKVFMVITAKTTDAYVGESIPVRIEFYIRMDSMAPQDSLPTIEGSDFLMNDLSVRPAEDEVSVMNETFQRDTWLTTIAASRSGDFPLVMSRDTYWNKNSQNLFADPLGNFFSGRSSLAHADVASNKLVIHARPLPTEGRPPGFTGAIGQFKAEGNASATTVEVGDPAYLDFSISGQGNFDSVRSPVLAPDPNWKTYAASTQMHFVDQTHLEGEKTFHQAIIPRKNGLLPLPEASFSYFDPNARQYVTIPIALPVMTVTGTAASGVTDTAPTPTSSVVVAAPAAPSLLGNRLTLGELQPTLLPAYRQPWYWLSQGALIIVAALALIAFFVRLRLGRDQARVLAALRRKSLQELEAAMTAGVQSGDAPSFFLAARRMVQLRWGAQFSVPPESVTLPVIAARDPQFAAAAAPLFHQADEVMYSGHASSGLDLVEWDRSVREELLHAQPA